MAPIRKQKKVASKQTKFDKFHITRKKMMIEKLEAEAWWNGLSAITRNKHRGAWGTMSPKRMVALYRIRNIK